MSSKKCFAIFSWFMLTVLSQNGSKVNSHTHSSMLYTQYEIFINIATSKRTQLTQLQSWSVSLNKRNAAKLSIRFHTGNEILSHLCTVRDRGRLGARVLGKGAKRKGAIWNLWLTRTNSRLMLWLRMHNYSDVLRRQRNASWVCFSSQLVPVQRREHDGPWKLGYMLRPHFDAHPGPPGPGLMSGSRQRDRQNHHHPPWNHLPWHQRAGGTRLWEMHEQYWVLVRTNYHIHI